MSFEAPLKVLIIGAGFSGICMGIKLLQDGSRNFRIVEKSPATGGTWYENTYPGATCDVPSHFYSYSFRLNPNWSRAYSPYHEIRAYLADCVEHYGLGPYIDLGAQVTELILEEEAGVWLARFKDGRELRARFVVNGAGVLHLPRFPDIKGRNAFAGLAMHTAKWDHTVDLTGKSVAVIGSAASAIQVVPQVAKVAERVTVFQRTANFIAPRNDHPYSDRQKRLFARWPWLQRLCRWLIMMRMELVLYQIVRRNSWFGRFTAWRINRYMRRTVDDTALHPDLKPDYPLGCKRILISDDFYPALNRDNVVLVTAPIERIEADGVGTTDGVLHEADVLVYATGFDINTHIRTIKVIGEGGHTLDEAWAEGPVAYNGACVAGFPNYFMVTGPNTGVGTTSAVHMIEQEVHFIRELMRAAGPGKLIGVSERAQADYNERIQRELAETVWMTGCSSWYIGENGRISVLYPKNGRAFKRQLAHVRLQDFRIA